MTTIINSSNPLSPGNAIQIVTVPSNVIGTDGGIPHYNPSAGFKIWSETQIYNGTAGIGKYIPLIGDIVLIFSGNSLIFTKVIGYNSDMTSVVQELLIGGDSSSFSQYDIFTGIGPGAPSDIFRVYVDDTVVPKRVNIDAMLTVSGTEAATFKLYKGASTGAEGVVVSMRYNGSGVYVDDPIDMKPLAQNNSVTVLWGFPEFHTNFTLADNEILTLVIYTASGSVYHHRQLLVQNVDYFRTVDYSKKEIDYIALQSPFMGAYDSIIYYPINTTVASATIKCVVNYKDGTSAVVNIDNIKAKIYGLNEYQATYVGQKFQVALQYTLGANESYIGDGLSINGAVVTRVYDAITSAAAGSFSYRLYCQPTYSAVDNRYTLNWWLHNLSRDVSYDASAFVGVNENMTPYDGTLFGIKQNLNVSLDVRDVDSSLPSYRHSQSLSITLNGSPAALETPFNLSYDITTDPGYGDRAYCTAKTKIGGNTDITVAPGLVTLAEWRNRMYTRLKPSFDPSVELEAPTPTHVIVNYATGQSVKLPIASINLTFTLPGAASAWKGRTLYLTYIYEDIDVGLLQYLASSSVYIR